MGSEMCIRDSAVSSVVSAYVRNVGRNPRTSHVDAAEELDQNIGSTGDSIRIHSPNYWQYAGELTCTDGDVHHAQWSVDVAHIAIRMARY